MPLAEKTFDDRLAESLAFIREHAIDRPRMGLILGSGLGEFAETLAAPCKISTAEIPHYPPSTVSGHKGNLVFGSAGGTAVMAVQGRTHYYEGHPIDAVAYVVRLMAELGVEVLLVTNAAGGVNPRYQPGDLMAIVDQINLQFANPLRGPLRGGELRFPDMNHCFDPQLTDVIADCARDLGIRMHRGVLAASSGPAYETAAEVKMIQHIGGDAASMSTVPEVIVARARGIRVAGVSCITNHATGLSKEPLSHEEVTLIARQVKSAFQGLLSEAIRRIATQEGW